MTTKEFASLSAFHDLPMCAADDIDGIQLFDGSCFNQPKDCIKVIEVEDIGQAREYCLCPRMEPRGAVCETRDGEVDIRVFFWQDLAAPHDLFLLA